MSDSEASHSDNEGISILERTPIRRKLNSDDVLSSLEKLDQSPPDLWQERKPITMNTPLNSSPPSWTKGLSQDDLNAMHQLGCLSVNGIFTEIRKIYDRAYQVGLMEATQISRGTIISVFSNTKKK